MDGEQKKESDPTVSVIIPTKNVENYIEQCLQAVLCNSFKALEIIVVDNGSVDSTAIIAKRYPVRFFSRPHQTIAGLRNFGASQSKSDILAFIDSDCIANPNWIENGLLSLAKEPAVIGYLYDWPDNATWLERDWFCQRDPGRTEVSSLGGGNIFVHKLTFEKIGGFMDHLITGEDAEFCSRARQVTKIISDDSVRVVHLGNPKTVTQFIKREIWYGLGAFGTFGIEKLDKPLAGTLIFILSIFTLFVGVGFFIVGGSNLGIKVAILLMIALLAATLIYRGRYIYSVGHAIRLCFLYFLFYLGRAISLIYVFADKDYYHNIKH